MKSKLTALFLGIIILACNKDNSTVTPSHQTTARHSAARFLTQDTLSSKFIEPSLANEMISSYLASIDYVHNDTDVRAFIINADSLRAYLADPSIKGVKIMFAHTKQYIDASYSGENAGYQAGALTIVIAGYDSVGNYKYHNGKVLDHATPCPYTCPGGTAGDALIY